MQILQDCEPVSLCIHYSGVLKQRDLPLGRSSGQENKELRQWNMFLRNDSTRCLLVFFTEPRGGTTSKTVDLSCGTVCLQSISYRKSDDASIPPFHYGPRLCNRIFWDEGS